MLIISRNGWGAGAIESLGTALIMQQPDIVDVILDFVPKIDFNKTDTEVSLFETTIRYLGGLLSGLLSLIFMPRNYSYQSLFPASI